jgi:hypothetical protein
MGYSITIQVRSIALGKEMVSFLREHGRAFHKVIGVVADGPYAELVGPHFANGKHDAISRRRGGLSYCRRDGHIGFDYGVDREYKYAMLKWMAQKVGARRGGKFRILYDGYEWFNIEPAETDPLGLPTAEFIASDNGKFHGMEWGLYDEVVGRVAKGKTCLEVVRDEMRRLDDLWSQRA